MSSTTAAELVRFAELVRHREPALVEAWTASTAPQVRDQRSLLVADSRPPPPPPGR